MKSLISFIVGVLFALGLGISGMTQAQVVRGFLDIFGNWNPALLGVMIGAISVHSLLYYFIRKRSTPLLDSHFHVPKKVNIDKKLLVGAAIFGIGWGWAGICPGPGIVSATSGNGGILLFVLSMIGGMGLFKLFENRQG